MAEGNPEAPDGAAERVESERIESERVVVYTDGACLGNPGPGGWAWIISKDRYGSGGVGETTNNRMELMAAREAIREVGSPMVIVTDSRYLSDCFEKNWWKKWVANGWRTSDKKSVKNKDLWQPIIEAYQSGLVEFRWVRGHAGNPGNEAADRLASLAASDQKMNSGYGEPGYEGWLADNTGNTGQQSGLF